MRGWNFPLDHGPSGRSSTGRIQVNNANRFICDNIFRSLSMTGANRLQDRSQENESHWLRLIGLKDDMKITPQNHSAVKGQNPWLCL